MTLTPIFEKLSSVIVIVKVNVIVVFSVLLKIWASETTS